MSKPLEVTDSAEGSVDWKAAENLYKGRTGEEFTEGERGSGETSEKMSGETSGEKSGEAREFRYRGQTLKVDPHTFSVLESLRREARGANGRLGSELARTRERLAKLEGALSERAQNQPDGAEEISPPDPMLATRDIAAWQRQYDAYHAAKLARLEENLENRYMSRVKAFTEQVEKTQRDKAWADKFYESYDHLDDPTIKPIVAQVYTEHRAEIEAFGDDSEGAYERLAELADERLVILTKAGKTRQTNTNRRPPRVESSAGATPRQTVESSPREFSASGWLARERLRMQGRDLKQLKE